MNQFVQRKTLLGMLVAALMCIAFLGIAAPQEAYADQGWNSDSKGWWYQYDGNSKHYYKNGWKKIDNNWFYFQKNGYAKQGWLKDGKYWYYLDQYYTDAPTMISGREYFINGKGYYFEKSGRMATGPRWVKYGDIGWMYVSNKSGLLATNCWKKIGGKWYRFGDDGHWATQFSVVSWRGVKTVDGVTYYFDKNTAMVTGWQKIDGKWYYFAKSGAMQKNKWVGNYWLDSDGVMATNAWVDNDKYYVDGNGKWVKGKTK